jgi:hypothetical protein
VKSSIVSAADRPAEYETLLFEFLTTGACFGMGQGIPNRFGISQESAQVADLCFARSEGTAYKREGQLPLVLAGVNFTY